MRLLRSSVYAWVLCLVLATPVVALGADDGEWITDKRGCKVANPSPRQGETITWSGECKKGFADGDGVLQWFFHGKPDDRYEGQLEMGWAHGKGVLTKPDGAKYDGEWKDSLQHGAGRLEWPDGSWYDGQWKAGKPHGHGQYRRPDGKLFLGEWIDGEFEGDIEQDKQDETPNRT